MKMSTWSEKLRNAAMAPFRWIKKIYDNLKTWMITIPPAEDTGLLSKLRNVIHQHPILSLTTLFLTSLLTTYLTGIWWLGGTLFVISMMLFTGNSVFSGIMRTSTAAFEMIIGLTMFIMFSAIVAPVPSMWMIYCLAPLAIVLGKAIHDSLAFSVFMVEGHIDEIVETVVRETPLEGASA